MSQIYVVNIHACGGCISAWYKYALFDLRKDHLKAN